MTDLDEQGLIETWHERFKRLVTAKDYAGALAMLRSSAPDCAAQVARAETAEARLQSLEKEVETTFQALEGRDARLLAQESDLTFARVDIRRAEARVTALEAENQALTNTIDGLTFQGETLKAERDEAQGDRDEYRDLLHDLVMLDAEEWAIGGGPGFKERSEKAWSRARERLEP